MYQEVKLMATFEVPTVILARYSELYDLVTNKSVDGEISAVNLAKYLGKSVPWVRQVIQNGKLPYAFGDSDHISWSFSCQCYHLL